MLSRDAADVHPPLYYILLKSWSYIFDTTLSSLRGFSVFFAGVTIASAYLFTSYAFRSRLAGLLASVLIAFSGFQIQFAWEARMYTLGTAFSLISSYFLIKALRSSFIPRKALFKKIFLWLLYSLFATGSIYTHYYAFFTIAAHIIFIIGYLLVITKARLGEILQSRLFYFSLFSFFISVVIFLPWLPTFLAQSSQVQESYWIPDIGGWSIPDTFYRMFWPTSLIPSHEGIFSIIISLIPITLTAIIWLLLILGVPYASDNKKNYQLTTSLERKIIPLDACWLTALAGIIPFVLSIGLSFLGTSLYQDRFLVFSHLYVLIALAVLIIGIKNTVLRSLLVIAIVIFFIFSSFNYWQELSIVNKPGAKAAVTFIHKNNQKEEPVIASSPFIYFSVLYYAQEEIPLGSSLKLYSQQSGHLHFAGEPILTKDDIVGPEFYDWSPDSFWVVDTTGFGSGPLKVPHKWRSVKSRSFPEVFIHQGEVSATQYQRI